MKQLYFLSASEPDGVNCDPPELQVNADLILSDSAEFSQHHALIFSLNVTSPKVKDSTQLRWFKNTCQLEIYESKAIMFPVASTLKISPMPVKARTPRSTNTDCICHSDQLLPEMGRRQPGLFPPCCIHWLY